jgi:uncharacterized protein (TIGR02246 family)
MRARPGLALKRGIHFMSRLPGLTLLLGAVLLAPPHSEAGQDQAPGGGRTVRVHDIEMYYEERGSGEPLVLLHGFGACGRKWEPFPARLGEHYRVIVPDLRGHGRSTNSSGAFTHRQAAADVFALLDRLGVGRFRAMGISTGGMTLLHMATQQPSRVEAMVLIGATHYFPEQARAIMRATAERPAPQYLEFLQECATRGETQARELAREFGAFKDSYGDMNFTPPLLGTIKARTLIVHGDRDEFFPVEIPVEMHRAIPGSALWIIPKGGHVPIFGERATEFREVVAPFLRGASAKGGRPSDAGAFDPEEIRAAERQVIQALESTDPTAWVYMYTEDAVFLESGPPVVGRQALLEMAKAMKPLSSVTISPERTEGRGDLAYVYCRGSWVNGRPPEVGTTSRMRGVMIWRKQSDGRWLIAQEVLVPDAE